MVSCEVCAGPISWSLTHSLRSDCNGCSLVSDRSPTQHLKACSPPIAKPTERPESDAKGPQCVSVVSQTPTWRARSASVKIANGQKMNLLTAFNLPANGSIDPVSVAGKLVGTAVLTLLGTDAKSG